jgi:hypothetical protein
MTILLILTLLLTPDPRPAGTFYVYYQDRDDFRVRYGPVEVRGYELTEAVEQFYRQRGHRRQFNQRYRIVCVNESFYERCEANEIPPK